MWISIYIYIYIYIRILYIYIYPSICPWRLLIILGLSQFKWDIRNIPHKNGWIMLNHVESQLHRTWVGSRRPPGLVVLAACIRAATRRRGPTSIQCTSASWPSMEHRFFSFFGSHLFSTCCVALSPPLLEVGWFAHQLVGDIYYRIPVYIPISSVSSYIPEPGDIWSLHQNSQNSAVSISEKTSSRRVAMRVAEASGCCNPVRTTPWCVTSPTPGPTRRPAHGDEAFQHIMKGRIITYGTTHGSGDLGIEALSVYFWERRIKHQPEKRQWLR